jgi:putative acetyltransferase
MTVITVSRESPDQPEIRAMIEALDKTLDTVYAGFCNYRLNVSQLQAPDVHFFVARNAEHRALGMGAVKFHPDFAEIKRMYCVPEVRGQGVGRTILETLFATARAQGKTIARLETGLRLQSAVRLYEKYGFTHIPAFDEYVATADTSYCMEAKL